MTKVKIIYVVLALICWISPIFPVASLSIAGTKIMAYTDQEYGFAFEFPSHWVVRKGPKKEEIGEIPVEVQSPRRTSVFAIVGEVREPIRRVKFESDPDKKAFIEKRVDETIDRIYGRLSKKVKAKRMSVNEKRMFISEIGVRFRLSTVHFFEKGNPILINGTHTIPFDRDYMISFIVSTTVGRKKDQERRLIRHVTNSFHLVGERRRVDPEK